MPQLTKRQLLENILSAITESEWNVLFISDDHPFRLQVYKNTESYRIAIYIWNISHGGGRARPENEFRIQITGVSQIQKFPGEKTLILGWWEENDVFAGFDVRKHDQRLGSSPSFQIKHDCLIRASQNGFSPCDKGNREIAIAFRPDFFIEYVRNLEHLHDFGESQVDLQILDSLAENPTQMVNDEDIRIQNQERKTALLTINKKLRDTSFRRKVLEAYRHQCAFCGLQMKLVDAAHILPVSHENSTDETRNGLALCSLHHRAFDQILVTVNENYEIIFNQELIEKYRRVGLAGGSDDFRKHLLSRIIAPEILEDRPHLSYIRLANTIRGWRPEQLRIG